MADVGQEKSCGLKFAEQQLLRHGWEQGKGLGKAENGRTEAIKVKLKYDKGGIGHKEGEQFTFHWWDHVFNKASSSLQVESDQTGIKLKKTAEEVEDNGMISNKKPRKAMEAKAKLYGCFVKSATLLCGQEQPEPKPSQSDDSSSSSSDDEGEEKLDLSSTTKLPDADLVKACGGRTAHKGARHGLTMSAKLARLEQQEAEFMAKYGRKSQTASAATSEEQEETPSNHRRKTTSSGKDELNDDHASENPEKHVKSKKKKRKLGENAEGDPSPAGEDKAPEELHTGGKTKKKKPSKQQSEDEAGSEAVDNWDPKTRIKGGLSPHEEEVAEREAAVKRKRKKCKKDKLPVEQSLNHEVPPPKKKKKNKASKD